MSAEYLLSVIVPIYNVENVLTPLVQQLVAFGQNGGVELVFVDDGATDRSADKVASLIAPAPYARLVHQANAGLSAARNHGLQLATGEYVWFVDSDDLLNEKLLPALLATLKDQQPDLLQFGFMPFADSATFPASTLAWSQATGAELFAELAENHLQNYAWAHIALRRLYEEADVRFPVGLQFEDMATTYKLFLASRDARVTAAPVYGYRQRAGSIVQVVSEQSMHDLWTIAGMITKETATIADRQHVSQLCEMAQLIALGRTMEGTESPGVKKLRHQIIHAYCHTHWEHQGVARLKTRLRKLLMIFQVYVPISRHRLQARP
ncbi:glycosyltransferase [Lacticaseibacillus sp. GG6-2]